MTRYFITPKGRTEPKIEVWKPSVYGGYFYARLTEGTGGLEFDSGEWILIEEKPGTIDLLNSLGENAVVAHRSDPEYFGYGKFGGRWVGFERGDQYSELEIAGMIDTLGFEIIWEGVK